MKTQPQLTKQASTLRVNKVPKRMEEKTDSLIQLVDFDFGNGLNIRILGIEDENHKPEFVLSGTKGTEFFGKNLFHLVSEYKPPELFLKIWPSYDRMPAMIQQALLDPDFKFRDSQPPELNVETKVVPQIEDPIPIDLESIDFIPESRETRSRGLGQTSSSNLYCDTDVVHDEWGTDAAYRFNRDVLKLGLKGDWYMCDGTTRKRVIYSSKSCRKIIVYVVACGLQVNLKRYFKWKARKPWKKEGVTISINANKEGRRIETYTRSFWNPLRKSRKIVLEPRKHKGMSWRFPAYRFLIQFKR